MYSINPEDGKKRGINNKQIGQIENKYQDINVSPILFVIILNINWLLIPIQWNCQPKFEKEKNRFNDMLFMKHTKNLEDAGSWK